MAQLVKNPPAVQETWVWSLGWEDPLEQGRLHTQYSALENSMDCIVHGSQSRTWLTFTFQVVAFSRDLSFSIVDCLEWMLILLYTPMYAQRVYHHNAVLPLFNLEVSTAPNLLYSFICLKFLYDKILDLYTSMVHAELQFLTNDFPFY